MKKLTSDELRQLYLDFFKAKGHTVIPSASVIPENDPTYNEYKDISQLPSHIFQEMKHFFTVYKELENKTTDIDEVKGVLSAVDIIDDSIARYKEKFKK